MKKIHILSESAAIGSRLRDILYQAGYGDIVLSDLTAIPAEQTDEIIIVYAKSRIFDVIQSVESCGCPAILLLNPDCYAMYIDRARHADITLLLMPVAPFALLDAVQGVIS